MKSHNHRPPMDLQIITGKKMKARKLKSSHTSNPANSPIDYTKQSTNYINYHIISKQAVNYLIQLHNINQSTTL